MESTQENKYKKYWKKRMEIVRNTSTAWQDSKLGQDVQVDVQENKNRGIK